jgi:hypothetical protein
MHLSLLKQTPTMKKIILFILICCKISCSCAQTPKAIYKIVPIITKQSFYLNGGARSMFGGVSREYLQVDLPPNTVEWYYSVTTSPQKTAAPNTNLTGQLVKLLVPDLGIASGILSSIIVPTGSGACDVYLMADPNEVNKFITKQPFNGVIGKDSRQNYASGVVQIKDLLSGSCYLTLRNPSGMDGLNITIEVAAIVKESGDGKNTAMQ